MTAQTTRDARRAPEVRELAVVTEQMAAMETTEDARSFLLHVIADHRLECSPMESSEGIFSFVTCRDGRGWTLVYQTEPVGGVEVPGFVRVTGATVIRNEAYDVDPREYGQYRITFYDSAECRIDLYEFAWLLSRHDVEVVAKPDVAPPALIVRATRGRVAAFCADVNRVAGPMFFRSVEGAGPCGYEELDEL